MSLDPNYIWDSYNVDELNTQLIFDKSTLTFALFHVNPDAIEATLAHLQEFLEPFIKYYPWFHSPPVFKQFRKDKIRYIYGEFIYQDSQNDEWLLANLLWEFLTFYPDLYIHLWDSSDFEFILVECSDVIPTWLEPNNSLNRTWINTKTVLVINPSHDINNLSLAEALEEILDGEFKKYPEITATLTKKFSRINESFWLDMVYDLEITLPTNVVEIFADRPYLISQSINEFIHESLSPNQNLKHIQDEKTTNLKVGIPLLGLNLIKFKELELQATNKVDIDFGHLASKILTVGLDNLMNFREFIPEASDTPVNLSRNLIQDKLLEQNRIKSRIPENAKILEEIQNIDETEKSSEFDESALIDKFNAFFSDTSAGIDGIENEELDREKIKQENGTDKEVDIDEDDFFEFFLKEALKLSDKDLEDYRNSSTSGVRKRKQNEFKTYSNESDYKTDTSTEYEESDLEQNDEDEEDDGAINSEDEEEEEYIKQFLKNLNGQSDVDGLANLLKSINTDIGPGSVLLQQGVYKQNNKQRNDAAS